MIERNDLVSIIVPIYNVERYLTTCLESLAKQTYSRIEVIMVNDGSTDNSREIALQYSKKDSRFFLFDKENGGLSSGRNYGLKRARGSFVCFVDSDDFLLPEYISSLKNSFEESDDIVIADYVIYDSKKQKAYLHSNMLSEQSIKTVEEKKELIRCLFTGKRSVMPVWKNMYRTSFLRNNNLVFESERMVYSEDFLFNSKAYSVARGIHIIPNIIYYHSIIYGSLSQGYRDNFFEMQKTLYKKLLEVVSQYFDEELVVDLQAEITMFIGSSMFHLCKCKFNRAISNVKTILEDDFTIDAYKNSYSRSGYFRYWFLFRVGRFKNAFLVVLVAKIMHSSNRLYRLLQKKRIFIAGKEK